MRLFRENHIIFALVKFSLTNKGDTTMRTKLTKAEIESINSLYKRVNKLCSTIDDDRDVQLNYGNGTVSSQLSCASAALWTILQELDENY